MKKEKEVNPLDFFDEFTIIAAERYYLGRMTIAACSFAQFELYPAWPHLSKNTQSVIKRDVEEMFRIDDESRKDPLEKWHPLGMDMDRAAWSVLRQRWKR